MTEFKINSFVKYLQKENWTIFGVNKNLTQKEINEISPYLAAHKNEPLEKQKLFIDQINSPEELILSSVRPFYSYKRFFIPEKETLFEYRNNILEEKKISFKTALLGITIKDLKATNLYDLVFANDPYYQKRRKNILIVGYANLPEEELGITQENLSENLKHLHFDIFLATSAKNAFSIFSGSLKGQRILEHFNYKNYKHIKFENPFNAAMKEKMDLLSDKLKNHHNQKIWEELGKICLECGKCSLVCPTCFCFRIDDQPHLEENFGCRQRCWDSCFYQEFSEVADSPARNASPASSALRSNTGWHNDAGGHKFLNTTTQRIYFWYLHKFLRIPDEFGILGCVQCGRCAKVCPVGIDIKKVLESL